MITEDYVSFETAKLLKEKGFGCNTNCYYIEDSDTRTLFYSPIRENHNASIENNELGVHINVSSGKMSAPTLQMAMKWLREVHDAIVNVFYDKDEERWCAEHYRMLIDDYTLIGHYNTYEEACESAIKYCLKYLI